MNKSNLKISMKLKNLSLAAVLVFATLMGAQAQEQKAIGESGLTPKFGIKGGVNFANLYTDDVKNENVKVGFNAGFYAKLPITKGLSIQPELLYSSKGAKLTYDNLFGSGEFRFNLNYVEVPVLLVINVAKNFNIQAGGYAAYLASANIKKLKDDGNVDDVASFDENDFNRVDYGLAGGLGFDIDHITLGARYNYGLGEIGKSGTVARDALRNSKNSAISVFLGIAF